MAQKATAAKTTDAKGSATHTTASRMTMQSPLSLQAQVLQIHRQYGNQAVQRMYESGVLQAKLKIGQPDDSYEREADRIADAVMKMPELQVQRQPEKEKEEEEELLQPRLETYVEYPIQRQAEEDEEEEEEPIQTKQVSTRAIAVTPNLASRIQSLKGGGQPLPKSERAFFEPRFGYDFSRVRVHSNQEAANIAETLNAKAFTTGRDVVFGAEQYTPEKAAGKRLLAHELTHVVQQGQVLPAAKTNEVSLNIHRKSGSVLGTDHIPRADLLHKLMHVVGELGENKVNMEQTHLDVKREGRSPEDQTAAGQFAEVRFTSGPTGQLLKKETSTETEKSTTTYEEKYAKMVAEVEVSEALQSRKLDRIQIAKDIYLEFWKSYGEKERWPKDPPEKEPGREDPNRISWEIWEICKKNAWEQAKIQIQREYKKTKGELGWRLAAQTSEQYIIIRNLFLDKVTDDVPSIIMYYKNYICGPLSLLGNQDIYLHCEVVPSIEMAHARLVDELGMEGRLIKKVKSVGEGGFRIRKVAGKNALSNHSLGTAIDINPGTNPMITNKAVFAVVMEVTGFDLSVGIRLPLKVPYTMKIISGIFKLSPKREDMLHRVDEHIERMIESSREFKKKVTSTEDIVRILEGIRDKKYSEWVELGFMYDDINETITNCKEELTKRYPRRYMAEKKVLLKWMKEKMIPKDEYKKQRKFLKKDYQDARKRILKEIRDLRSMSRDVLKEKEKVNQLLKQLRAEKTVKELEGLIKTGFADMPREVRMALECVGFSSGGEWEGLKDLMHFDFMGKVAGIK